MKIKGKQPWPRCTYRHCNKKAKSRSSKYCKKCLLHVYRTSGQKGRQYGKLGRPKKKPWPRCTYRDCRKKAKSRRSKYCCKCFLHVCRTYGQEGKEYGKLSCQESLNSSSQSHSTVTQPNTEMEKVPNGGGSQQQKSNSPQLKM